VCLSLSYSHSHVPSATAQFECHSRDPEDVLRKSGETCGKLHACLSRSSERLSSLPGRDRMSAHDVAFHWSRYEYRRTGWRERCTAISTLLQRFHISDQSHAVMKHQPGTSVYPDRILHGH